MAYDYKQTNIYPLEQLADMIVNGETSLDEVYTIGGLRFDKRPVLEGILAERERIPREDEEAWAIAQATDTIEAYEFYLMKYNQPGGYRGRHVNEAEMRLYTLNKEASELRDELFQAMRDEPWLFTADGMKQLINGVKDPAVLAALREQDDVVSRFLSCGKKVKYQELIDEGIIPPTLSREAITSEDHVLIQTNMEKLGDFPKENRTDVYFFGVPRGGKSSVLAGVLSHMSRSGMAIYQPHYNHEDEDRVRPYFYGMIESTQNGKFPVSTSADAVSFMKLDLRHNRRQNLLTFVELGGEAFRKAYRDGKRGEKAWGELGAGTCLKCNNRKLLFFIIDYSLRRNINTQSTESEQSQILNTALDILSQDGTGSNYSKGCTLSKVDTVAVIVTKSDLMPCEKSERADMAYDYVGERFADFMLNLEDKCQRFGINKPVGFKPYIIDFSLGQLNIGNTYDYDPADSERIVKFISNSTMSQSTGLLARIFGGN